jgi:tagaturonate reductase
MLLKKENLKQIKTAKAELPPQSLFELPEKVLQFGTGVLLRALPDYFIDKANKQGIFNGRVVVVKSTNSDSSAFDNQDGLYTVCTRGTMDGIPVEKNTINASISRVLNAKTEWNKILECAANPTMTIIISNTTEVGIQLIHDPITETAPVSFPGKLLGFLWERYKQFNGSANVGMLIVPTELITDNGNLLESVVLALAKQNNMDPVFIDWVKTHNRFCNTLVDRIVPGKPNAADQLELEKELDYHDELICMSEVFKLWAIEGDENVKNILSFAAADQDVVIQPDITIFKELKLRLLNGTHTFNCGLAFLSGFDITRDAVQNPVFGAFAKKLMNTEIAQAIPYPIPNEIKSEFSEKVFERFCNPFIDHQWLSITVQYGAKMKMRNIPLLRNHYQTNNRPPVCMATGFAAFILYMKVVKMEGDNFYGIRNGVYYEIKDSEAYHFYTLWQNKDIETVADLVLANTGLWNFDLNSLPGFGNLVKKQLKSLMENGVLHTIEMLLHEKEVVYET